MKTRRQFMRGVAIMALGVGACGKSGRKPTFPVSGKLVWDGKPIAHATVVFHPVNENGPDSVRPQGKTKEDGSFILTTYDGNDGAPVGDYRVTVELWLASARSDEAPSNRLPQRLSNPTTSGLSASVVQGTNDLKPIDLRRQ